MAHSDKRSKKVDKDKTWDSFDDDSDYSSDAHRHL